VGAISIGRGLQGKYLKGTTRTLRSDLNTAKMRALKDGVQYKVTVNDGSYTFWSGDLASGSTSWTSVTTTLAPHSSIVLSGGDFIFDPRGTASMSAPITLTNSHGVTRTLTVTLAGRIQSS
jgi:hypothetical protein